MSAKRDLLGEWLELGREVLSTHYPDAPHAALVIPQGEGRPDCVLVVTPPPRPSPTPTPPTA
jgi:hypothetical protein